MAENVPFGIRVKMARKALDLSQKELAAKVGCAVVTIQKIEEGQRKPSRQVAEILCRCLEIPEADAAAFLKLARAAKSSLDPMDEPKLGNLPAPLAPFIGRVEETQALRALLLDSRTRLVTVVGPPGVGKTRLSIETAAVCASAFSDGAWFVPLASLQDPALVLPTLARSFNVRDPRPENILERLVDHLRGQSLLLVLDNWEHLLSGAPVVGELLAACRKLKVLATSRVPLELYGERLFHLEPLSIPADREADHPQRLMQYDSVVMFVDRARAVRPGFLLGAENAPETAQLCRRLEGLPLAIELAAAGLYQADLPGLLAQIEAAQGPLNGLRASPRDFADRQRSLQKTIAWSYCLLDAAEQAVYRGLSVFWGSFSLAAARAVTAAADEGILQSLLRHHLVKEVSGQPGDAAGRSRYTMLELIHADMLERAEQAGEIARLRDRHAQWYVDCMSQSMRNWDMPALLAQSEADVDNLRAALGWLLKQKQARQLLELCSALRPHWEVSGYQREGKDWLETALALSTPEQLPLLDPTLAKVRGQALLDGSVLAFQLGDYASAQAWGLEGLGIFEAAGDMVQQATLLQALGRIAIEQGDYPAAEIWLEKALHLFRSIGDLVGTAGVLVHLAEVALGRNEDAAAEHLAQACLLEVPEADGAFWSALAYATLAELSLRAGNPRAAFQQIQKGLEQAVEAKAVRIITLVLAVTAAVSAQLSPVTVMGAGSRDARLVESAGRAARLWGAVIHIRESRGITFSTGHQKRLREYLAPARELLGQEAWQREEQPGKKYSLEETIQFARGLEAPSYASYAGSYPRM